MFGILSIEITLMLCCRDPEWADVKLAQAKYLLSRLALFRTRVSNRLECTPSVVVAGDFNSTPGDKVCQILDFFSFLIILLMVGFLHFSSLILVQTVRFFLLSYKCLKNERLKENGEVQDLRLNLGSTGGRICDDVIINLIIN